MLIQTLSNAPKIFAKFGKQTRTFCHKKMEKVIAKLESDRLELELSADHRSTTWFDNYNSPVTELKQQP